MSLSILIVDDNENLAKTFAKFLSSLGHETLTAFNGREAMWILKKQKIKLVLLDITMPEMDGYQVAKKIREDDVLSKTVLVALTGHGKSQDKLKAREAGFDHHIEKPASLEEIRRIVDIYNY